MNKPMIHSISISDFVKKTWYILFVLFVVLSCKKDEDIINLVEPPDAVEDSDTPTDPDTDADDSDMGPVDTDFNTDLLNEEVTVYFAQTHVQEPTREIYGQFRLGIEAQQFKLTGNREALIKVHLTSKEPTELVPRIGVRLQVNGESEVLPLNGPEKLDTYFEKDLGKVQHTLEDSFHAIIPKKWIQPGLGATLLIGNQERSIENIIVGAPTKIRINLFPIQNFDQDVAFNLSEDWINEFRAKLPFSEFEVQVVNARFEELTYPGNAEFPDVRVSSREQYHNHIGRNWYDESAPAWQWYNALARASGTYLQKEVTIIPILGRGGAAASSYMGWYDGRNPAVLLHELGHVFSLQHWSQGVFAERYPYKGEMHGIPAPSQNAHVGPIWGFDLRTNTFIPPTVQDNAVGGVVGEYKEDPMAGGGWGTQEDNFLFNHFSSYSVRHIQTFAEKFTAVWNEAVQSYATWSDETSSYSNLLESDGVNLPIERDVSVYSIMSSVSAASAQANIVYPPIGPYTTGIMKAFDPNDASDRAEAKNLYCPDGGCDVSLRITQGGQTKLHMLPIEYDPSVQDPTKPLMTRALNVRASDGEITRIELLSTPDADTNGVPQSPLVLYTWE